MECESCQFTWCEEATPRTGFHFQSCVNGLVVLNKDRRTYDGEHQNESLDVSILNDASVVQGSLHGVIVNSLTGQM